ncbi:MAG: Flp pilus assembly protein CpaB [Chloroflexota bacterium]|nr:Flp pilus assembly protein CpaB [Chloroflexota bacterium]
MYNSTRRKMFIGLGIVLAFLAAVAVIFLTTAAGRQPAAAATKPVIVAVRDIPARTVLKASDLTVRDVPEDPAVAQATNDPNEVVGRITGVTVFAQQPILPNLLLSKAAGGKFSILAPEESLAPNAPPWRAVSINVPDERAVGGQIEVGQRVDIFVTVQINVEPGGGRATGAGGDQSGGGDTGTSSGTGRFYTDKSTKITYQDLEVLGKNGTLYILKVDEHVAEEISHLQAAAGGSGFSIALRPEGDRRKLNAAEYGETTNKIVEQYGLPVPEKVPVSGR